MNKKIELKSMLLGAALGAVVTLCVAAASNQTWSGGRYQLVVSDHYAYKIDTATGQVWQTAASRLSADFKAASTEK